MSSSGIGRVDQGGGATDEGVVSGGGNDDEGLATLDSRRSVAVVALVLVDGEGLASDGGLIDLEVGILGDDAAISGNDSTFLNLQDIAGDDLGGLDLLKSTVTENDCLESESLLQFVDNGTSLEFLDETDTGVEQEKSADDTEIDPVFETGSKNSGSLSGDGFVSHLSMRCKHRRLFQAHFRGPIARIAPHVGPACSRADFPGWG